MHQTQHLATAGQHRQHALQQIAVMAAVADGTQSRGRGMVLLVHFGGLLDQQDLLGLAGLRARLLHMGADQLLIGHIGRLQEAIGRLRGRFILHLGGQGACRVVGDGLRQRHRALGPALISQVDGPKGGLGPFVSRQQGTGLHGGVSFFLLGNSFILSPVDYKIVINSQAVG